MSYYINQEKATEFQKWMKSDRAKELAAECEKETDIKYLDTYMPILGFGKYDCEDWFVAPDWSAFDKIRTSKASEKRMVETWDFIDQTRPMRSRVMRTIQETQMVKP
jgi:hypothetical protein